jgi:uncharacterized FlgJ-related protein
VTAFDNRRKPSSNSMEREARRENQRIEAERAMTERKHADEAFRANHERLKAERLAREARKKP